MERGDFGVVRPIEHHCESVSVYTAIGSLTACSEMGHSVLDNGSTCVTAFSHNSLTSCSQQ